MGATGSLLSSLAGQQDDGEEQNEEEWATKQVLRLVLFHEDRRQGFTQWLKAHGREKPLSAIAFWLDVSLVKLNLMYIASNSEGSKDTQLLAKYSGPVSIQLHALLTRLPAVDLPIPSDVVEYCDVLVGHDPASLLEGGGDAATDLVEFVEEIEDAILDYLRPDFAAFSSESESAPAPAPAPEAAPAPAPEAAPAPAPEAEAPEAATAVEPADLSVDVQELEKGSTKTVKHVPPSVLFVPTTDALELMKTHRGAIVLDLDLTYDGGDDAMDIVAKFRAFEQAQAIIQSQSALSTASSTTTASVAVGEGSNSSFLSSSVSPTPRKSWAATRSKSEIKRGKRVTSRTCAVVGITANEETQEQARAVGGFDVLALKPLSSDQALALLLRYFPDPSSSSSASSASASAPAAPANGSP